MKTSLVHRYSLRDVTRVNRTQAATTFFVYRQYNTTEAFPVVINVFWCWKSSQLDLALALRRATFSSIKPNEVPSVISAG